MKSILFMIALFFAIWFCTLTLIRAIRGQAISAGTFVMMAASLTLVLSHITGIW